MSKQEKGTGKEQFGKAKEKTRSLLERTKREQLLIEGLPLGIMVAVFFGLPLVVWGLVVFSSNKDLGGLLLGGGSVFILFFLYITLLITLRMRKQIKQIEKLKETNQIPRLYEIVQAYLLSLENRALIKKRLPASVKELCAIAALGDLGAEEAVGILSEILEIDKKFEDERKEAVIIAVKALDTIATQQGYNNREELLQAFAEKGAPSEEAVIISPLKVYPLEKLPVGSRCMVSHLEIHIEMDEVVACPYCEGFAKKELLKEWLEEKGLCPACRRRLRIEECSIVQLKEANGEKG